MPCSIFRKRQVGDIKSRRLTAETFDVEQARFNSIVANLCPLYTLLTHKISVLIQIFLFVPRICLGLIFASVVAAFKFPTQLSDQPGYTGSILTIPTAKTLQMIILIFILYTS